MRVIEFDQADNVVQRWGGTGDGYDWPDNAGRRLLRWNYKGIGK